MQEKVEKATHRFDAHLSSSRHYHSQLNLPTSSFSRTRSPSPGLTSAAPKRPASQNRSASNARDNRASPTPWQRPKTGYHIAHTNGSYQNNATKQLKDTELKTPPARARPRTASGLRKTGAFTYDVIIRHVHFKSSQIIPVNHV